MTRSPVLPFPRGRRGGNTFGVVVLALLIAGAVGAAAYLFLAKPSPVSTTDGRAVAVEFLNLISSGQVDRAWEGTTAEFKSLLGLDGLREYVRRHPALKSTAEFASFTPTKREDYELRECRFTASAPRGML